MHYTDQYQTYTQNTLVGTSPADLVVALYEGAIESTRQAYRCFESGDIMGRSKAVTKVTQILTELLMSINADKGGELTLNLKRLYTYMQTKMVEGHAKKTGEPFKEVEKLLNNLLEAWQVVAAKTKAAEQATQYELKAHAAAVGAYEVAEVAATVAEDMPALPYGSYGYEPLDTPRMAFTC